MLNKKQLDIIKKVHKDIHKSSKNESPKGDSDKEIINEESKDIFTDLNELQKFLIGNELPFISNKMDKTDLYGFSLLLSVLPKNRDECTFVIPISYNEAEDEISITLEKAKKGIDRGEFIGKFEKNPESKFNSFYDIVNMCDFDRFYLSYKSDVLDMIGRRFPAVKRTFELIDSYRRLEKTLAVGYDERRRKFALFYNPRFILASALEEWAINARKYSNLVECYCFTLGFLLAHEMNHIIRHHTNSSIGAMDVNTMSDYLNNIISDSFINVSLGNIFKGMTGSYQKDENLILSNGVGEEFSFRSNIKGGFSKFTSIDDMLDKIGEVVCKAMKVTKKARTRSYVNDMSNVLGNFEFSTLEGSTFFLKVKCDNDKFFRNSSNSFLSVINGILKVMSPFTMYPASEDVSDKEKGDMKPTIDADGALVGKKVRDKETGKIGVVVSDLGGHLKISFSDDPEKLEEIIKALKMEQAIKVAQEKIKSDKEGGNTNV